MFKEKVNARTDARRTTDHDISSLAYGQWSLPGLVWESVKQTIQAFSEPEEKTFQNMVGKGIKMLVS